MNESKTQFRRPQVRWADDINIHLKRINMKEINGNYQAQNSVMGRLLSTRF
jgi:hypothetical protein